MKTDVAVVGWGKAGKTLAMKLAGLGKQVVLIEQSPVMYGGTCINIACVPTKKLITEAVRRGDAEPNEYFTQAVERRDGLIGKLNDKNFHMVADLDNTTVIDGRATFVGDKQIQVETADGTVEVTADTVYFLIQGLRAGLPSRGLFYSLFQGSVSHSKRGIWTRILWYYGAHFESISR